MAEEGMRVKWRYAQSRSIRRVFDPAASCHIGVEDVPALPVKTLETSPNPQEWNCEAAGKITCSGFTEYNIFTLTALGHQVLTIFFYFAYFRHEKNVKTLF